MKDNLNPSEKTLKEPKKEPKITRDMNIIEIVQKYPETAEIFFSHGFHCFGCSAAHFETLEQGCQAHGVEVDKMVEELNKFIALHLKKNENKPEDKSI